MAETERTDRRIKISKAGLIAAALLACAILAATVFTVPRFAGVFKEYRGLRQSYKTAQKELTAAEKANAGLSQKVKEMTKMKTDSEKLSKQVFELAAKTEQDIVDGKSNKKICYITLDDGPYKRGQDFLELFRKYDVKATFFLTTANGDLLPDQADISASSVYPDYLRYGHTIGNHTYSHDYGDGGLYSDTGAFMKSVEDQTNFTEEATGGYVPRIVRFPGGSGMAGSRLDEIEDSLRERGYTWVDWTVDSGDSWGTDVANATLIKSNVLDASKEQDIMVVLFHEWSEPTLEAMPDIIDSLRGSGYIFLPLFPESVMVSK
ncbi:MAG: polysaccharide deacetylase family protein [Mogibacterium sp.]|nr:polysaccharide deacetylase family protein [Mogibacterium sp.]